MEKAHPSECVTASRKWRSEACEKIPLSLPLTWVIPGDPPSPLPIFLVQAGQP